MSERKNTKKVSHQRIIDRINREIGSDLKKLCRCQNIVDEYAEKIVQIEEEVREPSEEYTQLNLIF